MSLSTGNPQSGIADLVSRFAADFEFESVAPAGEDDGTSLGGGEAGINVSGVHVVRSPFGLLL